MFDMEKNVGGRDRTWRWAVGGLLVAAGVAGYAGLVGVAGGSATGELASLLAVFAGVVLLGTAYTQRCLVNEAVGRNTCRAESR